jgi:hypothetical protein
MKQRIILLTVLIAVSLGLVASTPHPAAAATSLKQLVLNPRDIPSSLGSFRLASPAQLGLPSGGLTGSSVPSSVRHAHDFQGSAGSFLMPTARGASRILLIDDGVYAFTSSAGAHWFIGATQHGALLSGDKVTRVALGSEGIAWSEAGSSGGTIASLYWRHGRYVGEVTAALRGRVHQSVVQELARIMDRKMGGAR